MSSFVRWCLQFRFLIAVAAGVVLAVSASVLPTAPVDALPEFSPPYVEIQTEALGLSAKEVEQMITIPLEHDLLAGVAWLDTMRSQSVPGLSTILALFEPGTDIYQARQMISERLSQAAVALPSVSKQPTMIQPRSTSSRFLMVGLSSESLSLIELSVLARWVIGPRLLGVGGVSNVAVWGMRDRQLQVLVDPDQLRERGVTLQQVVETTGNALWVSPLSFLEASTPGTGGFIDTPNQRLTVWHQLPIRSPDDLAQVRVRRTAWRLADIATVVEDHQPLIGDAIHNGKPGVMLVLEKLPGVNALALTTSVEQAIDALRPGMREVRFDTGVFRPASYLEAAISNLGWALLAAGILALLAVFAVARSWRTALVVGITTSVSLAASAMVLLETGATLNLLVLAGLAVVLPVIIHDAVSVTGAVAARLARGPHGPAARLAAVAEAVAENSGAIVIPSLVLLLALAPVVFIEGLAGSLFGPLALAFGIGILVSVVVALIVAPALSLLLAGGGAAKTPPSRLTSFLEARYTGLMAAIGRPPFAYGLLAVLALVSAISLAVLNRPPLLPPLQEPFVVVDLQGVAGTARPEMDRIIGRIAEELRGLDEVADVGAHFGRAVLGDRPEGVSSAELWVRVANTTDPTAAATAIEEVVHGYPGLGEQVSTSIRQTLAGADAGRGEPIALRVYGQEYPVLLREAQDLSAAIAQIDGVVDPHVEAASEETAIEVEVDLAAAQRFGVKPGDVRRSAAILLSGIQVGSLFEEQKVFDVVVWGTPETRRSVSDIEALLVDTPGGGHVPLSAVADVRLTASPVSLEHEALSAYLDVQFQVQGRDPSAVAADISDLVAARRFPLEYHAAVVGEFADRQAIDQRVLAAALIAAIGILLLFQIAFESWLLSLAAMVMLPVGLAGGVLAALALGPMNSLTALFGLLAVLAVSTRHLVGFTAHARRLRAGGTPIGMGLALAAARARLTEMLGSSLVIVAALLPLAVWGPVPGLEILHPMAIIVIAGLVTSLAVLLLVAPLALVRFAGEASGEPVPQAAE